MNMGRLKPTLIILRGYMRPGRRSFITNVAALAAAPLAISKFAEAATPKNMVVIGQLIDGIVNGFDPAEAYDAGSVDTLGNLYRTLVTVDPIDPAKLTGDLAQSWEITPDGLRYTFKLRPGLRFESGAPVTAEDVVFSLQRVIRLNRSPSFLLTQLGLNAANIDTAISATDPTSVSLVLTEARASGIVLALLTTTCAGVVDKKLVLANEKNGDLGNSWLRTHSAGAGAFRLTDWQASDRIILDANPNAAIKPRTPRLAIRHIAEPATELLLLKRNDLDIGRTLGSDELKSINVESNLDVVARDTLTLLLLQVNTAVIQFQKVQVRQAIKWAIDYDSIANNVTPKLWAVWQQLLPKGTPGALDERPFKRNVVKARGLMSEAGFASGFEVTLDHPNTWPYVEIAQALQANLGEIGIRLDLLAGSYGQVLAKRRARTHQMSLGRFSADHLDPSSFASYYCANADDSNDSKSKNGAWNAHFVDARLNAADAAANKELDPTKRLAIYADMQRYFATTSPFMFLLQKRDVAVERKGISGLRLGAISAYTRFDGIQKAI
jgi:peptide/nickel transport system substrate-binding protein